MYIIEFEAEDIITASGGMRGHSGAPGDDESGVDFGDIFG